MRMRTVLTLGALAWLSGAASALAQDVTEETHPTPDGSRVLEQSIVVPATPEQLWPLFTTSEGLMSWAVPMARVDFGLGGVWESSYDSSAEPGDPANIRNRFLAFVPLRMIAIQAEQAPPDFPHVDLLDELFSVIEFTEVSPGRTRVSVAGVGYREGGGWDVLYEHFRSGNRWTLEQLHRRITEGPVDWSDVETGGDPG